MRDIEAQRPIDVGALASSLKRGAARFGGADHGTPVELEYARSLEVMASGAGYLAVAMQNSVPPVTVRPVRTFGSLLPWSPLYTQRLAGVVELGLALAMGWVVDGNPLVKGLAVAGVMMLLHILVWRLYKKSWRAVLGWAQVETSVTLGVAVGLFFAFWPAGPLSSEWNGA